MGDNMSNETRLSIRMDKTELEMLKKYAESKHLTFSDWVRETLLKESGSVDDPVKELRVRLEAVERVVFQNAA